ncbi:unnamed protein product [Spirodela intermedia]|uniref:BHLH domain-containing protein n=1 Tax=Spirodela intermedia TaxID=51605 RepID=A0A7I8ITP3_SPIIN|nr:unnamed protein product [Spirodela intermedia]CAA6660927.1 unnamed protein product [Spirodela intermedia]
MDGGLSGQPSCYAGTSGQGQFDLYGGSFCDQTGLPGFDFKDGLGCLGVDDSSMSSGASGLTRPQFYQSMMIAGEFVQQSPLGEFFQPDQNLRSLSSSSMRSLSVGSPASVEQVAHRVTILAYDQFRGVQFPTPTDDDAAMARAMLAVMSSSSSSSSPRLSATSRAWHDRGRSRGGGGAFIPYDPTAPAVAGVEARKLSPGQEMMKRSFSILRGISPMSGGDARLQESRPTTNQLHHMISERKRREKLNESFSDLRTLLPPGTKVRPRLKDKASVLAGTIEQVKTLRSQISDLEEKNKAMEMSILPPDEEDGSADGVQERIRMTSATEPSSGKQLIEIRVTVPAECDMIDPRPEVNLLSLDASIYLRQKNPVRLTILTIRLKGGEEWDEGPFKEAVTRVINEALP